jgi:hypothetical protein
MHNIKIRVAGRRSSKELRLTLVKWDLLLGSTSKESNLLVFVMFALTKRKDSFQTKIILLKSEVLQS